MSKNIYNDAWEERKNKKAPEGYVGVRDAFKKAGLDDSKLGYKDGRVTYKGVSYTPDIIGDGVTYGSKQSVDSFIKSAAEADGDKVVRVNQYRPASGVYDVGWNDSTKEVLIGGKAIPYLYYDEDGNTFAKESVLNNAYGDIERKYSIENPYDTFARYEKKRNNILNDIEDVSGETFEFSASDLDNDTVWDAYKKMYEREGKRAYEDSMAKVRARMGGNMSSMAQAAADQAYEYYLSKMTDMIPEIAEQAYARYRNDKADELNALYKRLDDVDAMFSDEYSVRNDAYNRRRVQQEDEKQRLYDKIGLDVTKSDAETTIAKNAYDTADLYNVPVSSEVAARYGIKPDANGVYPTPNQIFVQKSKEIWDLYEKGVYDYKTAKELENYEMERAIALTYK